MKDKMYCSCLYFGFLLIFFLVENSWGQTAKIDSLKNRLSATIQAEEKIKILSILAHESYFYDPKQAKKYAQEAIEISDKNRLPEQKALALKALGIIYYQERKLTLSTQYFQRALAIIEKHNKQQNIADILHNIGLNYYSQGNYEKSLEYYMRSLAIEEKMGNEMGLVPSYLNIGIVLNNMEQPEQALAYYQKARKISIKTTEANINVPVLYTIAEFYLKHKQYAQALLYADTTLQYSEKSQMTLGIARSKALKAEIYYKQQKLTLALENMQEAEVLLKELEIIADIVNLLLLKAEIYENQQNFEQMKNTALEAVNLGKGIEDFLILKEMYFTLYKAYKNLNNDTEALASYEKFVTYKDSVYSLEKDKKINEILTRYETEKKELKIKELDQQNHIQALRLRQQNQRILLLSLVFILLIITLYLFYQQKRLELKRNLLSLEQRFLRSQLNPHFIFNALTAIQNYMFEQKPQQAGIYLAQFAALMRQILENSREEYISLEKEIDMLENYLSLQQLRFHNKFHYTIEISKEIEVDEISIPPMFAQPFVENAIEHGLANREQGGHIAIKFEIQDEFMLLEIQDNGEGIEKTKQLSQTSHKSLSTQITQERILAFKKLTQKQISFTSEDLRSSSVQQGTKVALQLPYKWI